jgi:glycosyltransferase involved in cell wall biosynthesis
VSGVRVLIFHGYLLRGTGSNIYNAELARSLVSLGHEVHLFCQDSHAADLEFVDAVGRWPEGRLQVEVVRRPVRCTTYLPDIGGLLPVYVADPYEGFAVRTFPQLTDAEIDRYLAANIAAVHDVAAAVAPDVALANHLVMGPVILARALAGQIPYAVKIHGSALEYVVRPHQARFGCYASEGVAGASAVVVGSRHVAESLWQVVDLPGLGERTRFLPPGVDVRRFCPRPPAQARARLHALAGRLEGNPASWGGEPDAAEALRAADPLRDRIVSYVGKLIPSKGVDLLIAAWPLVISRVPEARLVIAGFGTFQQGLRELVRSLGDGDIAGARDIARRGHQFQGGPRGELRYLADFLDGLRGAERERYADAGPRAMRRVHFTGRIEHGDIPDVMCASEAVVVPSTFPEAFGMVVAEAACCGALPLAAAHSGLREVAAQLAPALGKELSALLTFTQGHGAVHEIADKLTAWLTFAPNAPAARRRAREALAELARSRFGWQQTAEGVIAAAQGRLADLAPVPGRRPDETLA